MTPVKDIHIILVAFLAVLACFTTLTIIGSDGTELLRSVLLPLAGALGAVAAASRNTDPPK